MRKIIYSVCAALLLAATCGEQKAQANAGQMAVFYDNVGWIGAAKAKEIGDAIIAGVKSFQNPKAYNLDGVADWVEQNTGDGDVDCLVLFGYTPQTIYAPGNGEPEGSLVEEFIDDGNFVMNTADYIFYVTQGGGANAVGGLQNITDSTFDMWTDGNAIAPSADGKKYTPSLGNFTSNRSFKPAQIEADPAWEAEVVFGSGPLGYDPVIIYNAATGGRVGIWMQVVNDGLNRADVALEIFNNWVPESIQPQSVDPIGKAAALWGNLKRQRAAR